MSKPKVTQSAQVGFSLIEVLVATMVVAVVLTAIASMMTITVKNTGQAKAREKATNLAQEAVEYFNRENSLLAWNQFSTFFGTTSAMYCLNTLPAAGQLVQNQATLSGPCQTSSSDGFTREVSSITTLEAGEPTRVNVTVRVSWKDSDRISDVVLTRVFYNVRK